MKGVRVYWFSVKWRSSCPALINDYIADYIADYRRVTFLRLSAGTKSISKFLGSIPAW